VRVLLRNATLRWHWVTISLLLGHVVLVCECLLLVDNILWETVAWVHVWRLLRDDRTSLLWRKMLWGLVFW